MALQRRQQRGREAIRRLGGRDGQRAQRITQSQERLPDRDGSLDRQGLPRQHVDQQYVTSFGSGGDCFLSPLSLSCNLIFL